MMTMMKKRSERILLGFVLALVALFTYGYFENEWKDQALRASLGTRDDPYAFMLGKIKPGMTRQEVRKFIRGHCRLEEWPPTESYEGGVDRFHFECSGGLFWPAESARRITIDYDAQNRVKREPTMASE